MIEIIDLAVDKIICIAKNIANSKSKSLFQLQAKMKNLGKVGLTLSSVSLINKSEILKLIHAVNSL